jgi:aspartyl-tRNA(Asn)/glutamyl-tRNA(Gln) amidotransferase subunit C
MDTQDILHLAQLARLDLTEEEIERFPGEIAEILEFVSQVQEYAIDDEIVRDMRNHNSFRDDVVRPSSSREDIIDRFPQAKDGYLEVPKIISN